MLINYHCFGDVISLNTIYCTNRDHWPLAIFLEFNHYRWMVIFETFLLYDETIESFKWFFQTFLQAHNKKNRLTIFTNQDQVMKKHYMRLCQRQSMVLCIWHIMRNWVKHLENLTKDDSHFLQDFKKCMYDYDQRNIFWKLEEKFIGKIQCWRKHIVEFNIS